MLTVGEELLYYWSREQGLKNKRGKAGYSLPTLAGSAALLCCRPLGWLMEPRADQAVWLEEVPGHVLGLPELSGLQLFVIRVIKSFRISGSWVVEMLDMSEVMADYLDFGDVSTSSHLQGSQKRFHFGSLKAKFEIGC